MTVMTMPRWLPDLRRRSSRWLAASALLALTPKCLLCLLAYAGIGAALGLGGPEMCGAPAGPTGSWTSALALSGITLGVVGFLVYRALTKGSLLAESRKRPHLAGVASTQSPAVSIGG